MNTLTYRLVGSLALMGQAYSLDAAEFEVINKTEFTRIVGSEAKLVKLAGNMKFTEGPIWVPEGDGYLIFSELMGSEMKKWSHKEGLTVYRQPSHRVDGLFNYNGNTLDREGRLITAGHGERRLTRNEKDGKIVTLIDHYLGRKLNSPNDVVVRSDGTIYFTDPEYGIKPEQKEQSGNYVYRIEPQGPELIAVATDFLQPNGLCFSPDEKKLYVADSSFERHHIRVFDVNPNGMLTNGKIFCTINEGLPDGIRCDVDGRVYSSSKTGIQIYSPDGMLIGKILVPEEQTTNLCFGDTERKTLFITTVTSLYAIKLSIAGAGR